MVPEHLILVDELPVSSAAKTRQGRSEGGYQEAVLPIGAVNCS